MKKQIIPFFSVIALFFCSLAVANAAPAPLQIFNDPGSYPIQFDDAQPFINEDGRTMIPADSIDRVFQGGIQYTAENDTVTIIQTGLEYTTTVKMAVGSTVLHKNGEPIKMDTPPIFKDGQIYLPLRATGLALEHDIHWNPDLNWVNITYDSAEIYLWNEDKNSSEAGLHYAVFQGILEERDLNTVYARSTADFHEIEALFDRVPKGDIHLYLVYPTTGYKIPDGKAEEIKKLMIDHFGPVCSISERLMDKLPPIIQGTGEDSDKWYSKQLTALGEKGLKYSPTHTYRFTYLRSFDNPLSIRIEVLDDGTGVLYFTMSERSDGTSTGDLIETQQKDLTKEQTNTLLQLITDNDFWNLPITDEIEGVEVLDGSHWIIEGINEGKYHLVDRHSPKDDAVYALGNMFLSLYGGDIGRKY